MPASMRRPVPALAAAVLLLSCATSRYRPKGESVPYAGYLARLPSGMQVVVYQVAQVDHFTLTVSYGSGQLEDPPGKEGLAHLVEHLTFRGGPAGAPSRWERLSSGGWRFDARTTYDATEYVATGRPEDLGAALRLEAERMREPLAGVDEAVLAAERDVLVREHRERLETDPEGAQLGWLLEAAFGEGPAGKALAGFTPESVRAAAALADVQAWTRERYVPSNAIVVVVAPAPPAQVMGELVAAFGELAVPAGGARVAPRLAGVLELPPLPPDAPPPVLRTAPVRQPVLRVAWPVPGPGSRTEAQGQAAADALQVAFAGVLERTYGTGAPFRVDGFQASLETVADLHLLVLRVELANAGDARRVADLARSAALELVASDEALQGFDPLTVQDRTRQVRRTRDRLLVEAYLALERVDGGAVARYLRLTGEPDYLGARKQHVTDTLNADISTWARDHLPRERSVALLVVPDQGARAAELAAGRTRPRAGERVEPVAWEAPGDERGALPRPAPLRGVETRILPNGLSAVLVTRGYVPAAEVRLVVRTSVPGSRALPAGGAEFALWASEPRLSSHGETRRASLEASPFAPSERSRAGDAGYAAVEASRVGATRALEVQPEALVYRVAGSSANLDVLVGSTARWVKDLSVRFFDEGQDGYLRAVARREHEPASAVYRELLRGAFPDHPYSALPSAATLRKLPADALAEFFAREVRPERATVVVTSNQPASPELWRLVEAAFGGWSRRDAPRVEAPAPADAPRRVVIVDQPGAKQALVGVALRAPRHAARDRAGLEAAGLILEARLADALQAGRGTQGVRVEVLDWERAALLVAGASVDRDAAASTLATTLGAAGALAGGVTPEEARRARWRVARRHAGAFDTVGETSSTIGEAVRLGLEPAALQAEAEAIATLDAARVQAAAAGLAVGQESIVILGDAEVLLPQLQAAGFTPEVVKP